MRSARSDRGRDRRNVRHVSHDAVLALYDQLDPEERARVRQELLRRAGEDERERRARRSRRTYVPQPPDEPFIPPSEDLIRYVNTVREALRPYVALNDRYQPGDESRIDLQREAVMLAMEPLEWLLKTYFRYEVRGLENVPKSGRAMIISNHGLLPVDGWFLFYEIRRATGRWPRGLTDWRIYRFPYLRQLFMDLGMVVGSHRNGDALLEAEQIIFIMPGGSKEAWKSSKYRYRLLWRGRYGFIRMALRTGAPIIPSANVGTDDTYRVFFDGYTTAYKLFRTRRALLPISLPIGVGLLPIPARMTQYVGKPIHLPYPPEAAEDPAVVEECQEMVKSRVYELIDLGLRERAERKLENVR